MKFRFYLPILLTLLSGSTVSSFSQVCSCGGVPLASSIDKTVNRAGDLRVSAKYEFGIIDDLVAGNKELTNDSRSEAVQAIIIDSSYGISDRFSVLAFITYWFAWGAFYPGADIYSE